MSSILTEAATSVIHRLSQEILNFSMYMLGCKAALEQDLSIGAIFRRKTYWDVPLILSTRLNGMYLSLLVLVNTNIGKVMTILALRSCARKDLTSQR